MCPTCICGRDSTPNPAGELHSLWGGGSLTDVQEPVACSLLSASNFGPLVIMIDSIEYPQDKFMQAHGFGEQSKLLQGSRFKEKIEKPCHIIAR